jgi:hypothetical protein
LFPFLFPVLTSLLLAQQHDRHKWITNPMILKLVPIHINTNISVPRLPPICSPAWDVMTFRKIMNMTVAMMVAAAVRRAAMKVQIVIGKLHHLEKSTTGVMKMETKFMQTPARKKPNMRWLAILIRSKILLILAGSAIVAPERSSLSRISTGLNQ